MIRDNELNIIASPVMRQLINGTFREILESEQYLRTAASDIDVAAVALRNVKSGAKSTCLKLVSILFVCNALRFVCMCSGF